MKELMHSVLQKILEKYVEIKWKDFKIPNVVLATKN